MRERARRLSAPLAVFAAAAIGCAELGTDPQTAVAIEFDRIPYPAVITGDTLRDSAGVATPFGAVAYNGRGAVIAGAAIRFISLDTGAAVGVDGFLVVTRRDGFVRVIASANGLQSLPRRIEVTRRPDTLVAPTDAIITFPYVLPDAAANVTPALRVTVRSDDVAGGLTPNVVGWIVRWRAIHNGDTLGLGDTTLVALSDEGTRRSSRDTTGTDGVSSRRLRVFANNLPVAADSFIVIAEVRRHGVQLRGSPVRFVVNVAPETP